MNINLHTSHPSAFISSTFIDLQDERKIVADVLTAAGVNVNALDIKPASSNSSKSEILRGIEESDFVILIVGCCYGSIIPEMTGSDVLSITCWEYLQAADKFQKNCLVFFKRVDDSSFDESAEKQALLLEFRNILSVNHNPKYFSTPEQLRLEIQKALIPVYRNGIVSKDKNLKYEKNQVDILRKENEALKLQVQLNKYLMPDNFVSPRKSLSQPVALGIGVLGGMAQKSGLLDRSVVPGTFNHPASLDLGSINSDKNIGLLDRLFKGAKD